ncbi:hypothetical protein PCH_Pc12g12350 [Penicillium rubens Wisconsin 54-1255]|uniref:Uncharacterized protein n=2 Tax=Penicillium chrysogenum species complex TaxID=254878 RepID=B6GYL9_PENRW|nr:hypothetical protein PCH_Pc12g12350 [Penicillium rubens Wisconsin 54-1255]
MPFQLGGLSLVTFLTFIFRTIGRIGWSKPYPLRSPASLMPQGTGTLTSDKGRVLGQFEVEGAQYIFVGNLTSFGQSFSVPNADVTYDSADQLRKEAEEFEELPIEKDQIEIKLKNGVAITGGFDMPFSDGEVKKGTIVGGGGKWLKL